MLANNRTLFGLNLVLIALLLIGVLTSCKQGSRSDVSNKVEQSRVELAVYFTADDEGSPIAIFEGALDGESQDIDTLSLTQLEGEVEALGDVTSDDQIFKPSLEIPKYHIAFDIASLPGASCYADSFDIPSPSKVGVESCQGIPEQEVNEKLVETPFFEQEKIPVYDPNATPLCETGVDCECDSAKFYMCKYFNGGEGCYFKGNKCNTDNDLKDKTICESEKAKLQENYLGYEGKTLTDDEKEVLTFAKNNSSKWCSDL